jgi:SAM-dependent methyltransferase
MRIQFNQDPQSFIAVPDGKIASFLLQSPGANIDESVVKSFGEEWKKFHEFSEEELSEIGDKYFDIVGGNIVNRSSYCIDIGCGTGRWSKYLAAKVGFIEAIDPSDAILVAGQVLKGADNVRLSKASTDNIPFADETFDFGMSVGVLHHIPDTSKALADCVKKIRKGGYFYVYLYYALDNRGILFRTVFFFVNLLRKVISSLPTGIKKFACDIMAILIYMPVILAGRFFCSIGLKKIAARLPLNSYHDRSFFVIRNDALDRFGTKLEQRFSRKQVISMMQNAGLEQIVVSDNLPYWHAIGKRTR